MKKQMLIIASLAFLIGLLILIVMNRESCDSEWVRIKKGMSKTQVEQLFGRPPDDYHTQGIYTDNYGWRGSLEVTVVLLSEPRVGERLDEQTWYCDGKNIFVGFDRNEKAVLKGHYLASNRHKRTFLDRLEAFFFK